MPINLDKEKLVLDSKLLHHLFDHIQDDNLKTNLGLIKKDLDAIIYGKPQSLTYEELLVSIQTSVEEISQKILLLQAKTEKTQRLDPKTEQLMETIAKWQQDVALLSYFKQR